VRSEWYAAIGGISRIRWMCVRYGTAPVRDVRYYCLYGVLDVSYVGAPVYHGKYRVEWNA
jgi:hypothetical protein